MKVEINKPFQINNRDITGSLKDHTTFRLDEHNRIRIWFRDLKVWVNPPNDTNMETRILKDIEKYGVIYK